MIRRVLYPFAASVPVSTLTALLGATNIGQNQAIAGLLLEVVNLDAVVELIL